MILYQEVEREEITDKTEMYRVVDYLGQHSGYLKQVQMSSIVEEQLKENWINACCQILKDISITFLKEDNLNQADSLSDRDIFQAVGESIRNFPIPDFPPKTK